MSDLSALPYLELRTIVTNNGITALNSIQCEAIRAGLFFHKNLFINAPAGSGKTLIADLAVFNTVLKMETKVLYLAPYKSLALEKLKNYQKLLQPYNLKAILLTADALEATDPADLKACSVIVATYEKAEAFFRSPKYESLFGDVGVIIVDEVHELGTPTRGGYLEITLMNLLLKFSTCQFILLSGTMANYEEIWQWLNSFGPSFALIYSPDSPTPIAYHLEIDANKLQTLEEIIADQLAEEKSVLIFVNTRTECVRLCAKLHTKIKSCYTTAQLEVLESAALEGATSYQHQLYEFFTHGIAYHNASLDSADRWFIEKQFRTRVLKVLVATTTLSAGVNLPAHTVIIFDPITHRTNLYFKPDAEIGAEEKVIDHTIVRIMPQNLFFQMCGRAGRLGLESHGEVFVLVRSTGEFELVNWVYFKNSLLEGSENVQKNFSRIASALNQPEVLYDAMLIFAQQSFSHDQLRRFFERSLLSFQHQPAKIHASYAILQELQIDPLEWQYLRSKYPPHDFSRYEVTKILDRGKELVIRVEKHDRYSTDVFTITLSTHSPVRCTCRSEVQDPAFFCPHIVFLIHTLDQHGSLPLTKCEQKLRNIFSDLLHHNPLFEQLLTHQFIASQHILGEDPHYVITRLGQLVLAAYCPVPTAFHILHILPHYAFTEESYLLQKIIESALPYLPKFSYDQLRSIAEMWMEETHLEEMKEVMPRSVGVADLYQAMKDLARFAFFFTILAEQLYLTDVMLRFTQIEYRLGYGVKSELIPLITAFPHLSRARARQLYQTGYTTPDIVQNTLPEEIAQKTHLPISLIYNLQDQNEN